MPFLCERSKCQAGALLGDWVRFAGLLGGRISDPWLAAPSFGLQLHFGGGSLMKKQP